MFQNFANLGLVEKRVPVLTNLFHITSKILSISKKCVLERNFKIVKILTKLELRLVSTRIDTNNNKTLFMYYLIPRNYILSTQKFYPKKLN